MHNIIGTVDRNAIVEVEGEAVVGSALPTNVKVYEIPTTRTSTPT